MNEKEIFQKAENWLKSSLDIAIAYVVETWGSSPRPVGSPMIINSKNEVIGSVSGGCIESFVLGKAIEVIKKDKSEILEFGVSNKQAWDAGLTCGGKVKVLLEKISSKKITEIELINQAINHNNRIIVATNLETKEKIIFEGNLEKQHQELLEYFIEIDKGKRSVLRYINNSPWFFKFFGSRYKIIIIGAVHISETLIKLSKILNFEIYLIDPRNNYDEKKYNGLNIIADWPDEALKKIGLDNYCAVVTLTHDSKLDDPAIFYALKKKVFYLGCLGSTKTHSNRIERLKKKGFSEERINFIRGPIGLKIGAKSPEEIATSIISEIILYKNKL